MRTRTRTYTPRSHASTHARIHGESCWVCANAWKCRLWTITLSLSYLRGILGENPQSMRGEEQIPLQLLCFRSFSCPHQYVLQYVYIHAFTYHSYFLGVYVRVQKGIRAQVYICVRFLEYQRGILFPIFSGRCAFLDWFCSPAPCGADVNLPVLCDRAATAQRRRAALPTLLARLDCPPAQRWT